MSYRDTLRARLIEDEGLKPFAYTDHLGYWTIGVGHLIDKRVGGRVSQAVIDLMLSEDMDNAERDARELVPGFDALTDARKVVVVSMSFQMGRKKFGAFTNTLAAINEGRWLDAAAGMRNSLWASQTPARAERLARMMEDGVITT